MKETVEVMRHLNALEIITTWVGDKINFLVNPIGIYFLLLAVFFLFISGLNLKTNIDRSIFLILGILLSVVFFTTSTLIFIIAFEGLTAGLAFMIWTNGVSARKNLAAGKMITYSLISTIPFFFLLWVMINKHIPLTWEEANKNTQIWMLAFFLAMGTKLAVPPMHSWLPEAHVEAPTGGSMLLASTMLKVGGYGLLLGIPDSLTPIATAALIVWGVVGSTIASITVIRQTDLKKIIAYSSSAHCALALPVIAVSTGVGKIAAILLLLAHALPSAGLFAAVGVLYDRYHTRTLRYYRGFSQVMTTFLAIVGILTLANYSFPGSINFLAEVSVLVALSHWSKTATVFVAGTAFLITIYNLWAFNRMWGGYVDRQNIKKYATLTKKELLILVMITTMTIVIGIHGEILGDMTNLI